jgi:hypothetical protein
MFDTGSSIIYALTSKCQKGCPQRLPLFLVENSNTFQEDPEKRQDQNYGHGFVTGSVAKDSMCFGEQTQDCPKFEFLAVDRASDLQKDQFSGIVGLAPPSSEEKSTVVPTLQQMKGVFAFYLSKGAGSEGNLKFGSYDLQKFAKAGSTEKDITWTQVVDEGWTIPLQGVSFAGGKQVEVKAEQLTLDTGLTYALVPPRDIESIADVLRESRNLTCKKEGPLDMDLFACNCSKAQYKELQPLRLQINEQQFSLPKEAWMEFKEEDPEKPCKILMHPYDISMTATYRWVLGV